jgi:hypothetical protein
MKYFDTLNTVESIKQEYRRLAMLHHPDKGGDLATMQEINEQYLQALKRMDGATSTGTDGKEHTYKYNAETETEIMTKIRKTLAILTGGADLVLIGLWVWILNTEKGDSNGPELKKLGFKWMRHRGAWAWKPYPGRTRRSRAGLDQLAARYGATRFAAKAWSQDQDKATRFRLTA